MYLVIICQCN